MKKILLLLILTILLTLTSCWKTEFNDLSEEKQEEITNYAMWVLAPEIWKAMQIAFDFSLSEEEQEKKMNEFKKNIEKVFEEKIKSKYPNVIFWDYKEITWKSLNNKDNSREEEQIQEQGKIYTNIKLWEYYEFNKSKDEKIKIKVNDIVWKWKEYWNEWFKKTAKNEFLFIRLEAENTWKKPIFKWLWNIKLITKDWIEFFNKTTEQNPKNLKDWYSWCIECKMNPMDKAEQYIVFDINKIDLTWAKLRFEDNLIDFEL